MRRLRAEMFKASPALSWFYTTWSLSADPVLSEMEPQRWSRFRG